jgi:hypothetical protein
VLVGELNEGLRRQELNDGANCTRRSTAARLAQLNGLEKLGRYFEGGGRAVEGIRRF